MTTTVTTKRSAFEHERLQVYDVSIEFLATVHDVLGNLPRNRTGFAIGDQLQRAATSIALNIAEGSGEFSAKDKVRFYRYSVRSAAECAAVLDILANLRAVDKIVADEGKETLHKLTAMLLALIRSQTTRSPKA